VSFYEKKAMQWCKKVTRNENVSTIIRKQRVRNDAFNALVSISITLYTASMVNPATDVPGLRLGIIINGRARLSHPVSDKVQQLQQQQTSLSSSSSS